MTNLNDHLRQFEIEILQKPRPSYELQLKIYAILVPILGVIIIVINLMVVLSSGLILKKRQQPRSTYIFLGNVALADMLTGFATLFGYYYPKERRTEIVCCIEEGMIISATLASVYSILLIAIDRYLYIMFGLQYQRYLASRRARLMVIGTWLLGFIIGFIPLMGIRNSTDNGRFCWLIVLEPIALLLITVTVGIMPLFLVILLYSLILKRALGKITEMQNSEAASQAPNGGNATQLRYFRGGLKPSLRLKDNNGGSKSGATISYIQEEPIVENRHSHKSLFNCCRKSDTLPISSVYTPSRWKAIKIVGLTTGCFFVTWFPYFLACLLYGLCDREQASCYCDNLRVAIASPLAVLGFTNSLLNPIIYAWWHNGFRESVKKMYDDIWRKCILKENNSATGLALHRRKKLDSLTRSTESNELKTDSLNERPGVCNITNELTRSSSLVLDVVALTSKQS